MIPVNEPSLGARELEYVTECLRSGWISSSGKYIEQFEEQWASYCGRRFGIAVSNGTVALQLAVKCLNLQPGDEVILPTFTIISCALAVLYNGGVPVLVDSDPRTWCMDVQQLETKITPRTRALIAIHVYGHPVNMDPVLDVAERHGLAVVEDAAEAHGAEYYSAKAGSWRRCGSFGAVSCFSFYANKLITTGEGGMLLTDDPKIAEAARSYRNLCFQPDRRFYHTEAGFNFRLTSLQAALGVAQLERMDEIIKRKRWMATEYTRRLSGLTHVDLPVEERWARNVYWMYGLMLHQDVDLTAAQFASELREKGIETRPFFLGMHEQPVFRNQGLFVNDRFPVAENLARKGLYIPSGLALSEDQIETTANAVIEILS